MRGRDKRRERKKVEKSLKKKKKSFDDDDDDDVPLVSSAKGLHVPSSTMLENQERNASLLLERYYLPLANRFSKGELRVFHRSPSFFPSYAFVSSSQSKKEKEKYRVQRLEKGGATVETENGK